MVSREDCVRWLVRQGWEPLNADSFGMADMLHEFSRTMIGHWPDESDDDPHRAGTRVRAEGRMNRNG